MAGRITNRTVGLVGLATAILLAIPGRTRAVEGPGPIVLRETVGRGASSRVKIELRAEGLFRPAPARADLKDGAKMPKPLAIKIQTRLMFYERVLDVFDDPAAIRIGRGSGDGKGPAAPAPARGRPRKAARQVIQAAAAISGDVRPRATRLRPEIALVIAERRREDGTAVVVSPSGPLERAELELVEVEGDPLILTDILPAGPVSLRQSWRVGTAAAMGISGYDTITKGALDATLERLDDDRAQVRVRGRIEGSLQGAPGYMACDGLLSFDRRMGWIDRFEINRNENRQPGPVEAGMEVKSTITMTRAAEPAPATLSDAALARVPMEVSPRSERLVEHGPGDRTEFLHDRSWHSFWGNERMLVLKRMDGPRVVAQCHLMIEPPARRGKHMDPNAFRDEVRRAMGDRFVDFIGMGEVDGDPAGGYRYKLGVQGREGGLTVVRYYYLIAAPTGEQLVVNYTLAAQDVPAFGEEDVAMMRTLRWLPDRQAAGRK